MDNLHIVWDRFPALVARMRGDHMPRQGICARWQWSQEAIQRVPSIVSDVAGRNLLVDVPA